MEDEEGAQSDKAEAHKVIPGQRLFQEEDREDREDRKGDDLLDAFQLGGREIPMPDPVCRHHQQIFEEGDAPADEDDRDHGGGFEFQMAVPSKGHEDVRDHQKADRHDRDGQVEHKGTPRFGLQASGIAPSRL